MREADTFEPAESLVTEACFRALRPEAQRALAEQRGCRRIHTLDTSHSPFFSAPAELAKMPGQIAET